MESTPQAEWKSGLRTAAFAVLGAAVLVSIVGGTRVPFAGERLPAEASVLMRGGDTVMQVYYLAVDAGWEEDRAKSVFLQQAAEFYLAAQEADPSDFHARLSVMFVLRGLGRDQQAASLITPWKKGQFPEDVRKALGHAYAMVASDWPSPEAMEGAHDYLFGMGPGPLLIANGYREIDDEERARETLAEAAERSRPLLRRLVVAGALNATIVLCGIAWLMWLVLRRRSPPRPGEAAEASLTAQIGPREATEALILWVFASTVFAEAASALPLRGEASVLALLSPSMLAAIAAIGWVWIVAGRGSVLGWRLSSLGRRAISGVAATGLSVIPVLLLYSILQEVMGRSPAQDPIVRLLAAPESVLTRVAIVVGVGLIAPALEETLFRGIVFGGLRSSWSFWPAAAASAALFAVAHLNLAGFAAYFLLGLLFAHLFERSRSLIVPWAAHAAFNIFNLAMLLTLYGS